MLQTDHHTVWLSFCVEGFCQSYHQQTDSCSLFYHPIMLYYEGVIHTHIVLWFWRSVSLQTLHD